MHRSVDKNRERSPAERRMKYRNERDMKDYDVRRRSDGIPTPSGSRTDFKGKSRSVQLPPRFSRDSSDDDSNGKAGYTTPRKRKIQEDLGRAPKKGKGHHKKESTDDEEDFKDTNVMKELKDDVKRLQEELDTKGLDLLNKDKEILKLKKKAELKQKTVDKSMDLERRNKKLVKEVSDLKSDLEIEKLVVKNAGKNQLEGDQTMKNDLKRIREERDELKQSLKRIRNERDELRISFKKEKATIERMKKENESSEERIKKEIEKQERIKKKNEAWEEKVKDLEHKITSMTIDALNGPKKLDVSSRTSSDDDLDVKIKSLKIDEKRETVTQSEDDDHSEEDLTKEESEEEKGPETPAIGDQTFCVEDSTKIGDSEDIFLASDTEFEDSNIRIGNSVVQNYIKPKYSAASGISTPSKYISQNFKPVVTTINNSIIFVAVSGSKGKHNPANGNGFCGLSPECNIKWNENSPIGQVFIFDSIHHPNNLKERWVCWHHVEASMSGTKLQIQNLARKRKPVTEDDEVVIETPPKEDAPENVKDATEDTKKDALENTEANMGPKNKPIRSRLSLNKKNKKLIDDVAPCSSKSTSKPGTSSSKSEGSTSTSRRGNTKSGKETEQK